MRDEAMKSRVSVLDAMTRNPIIVGPDTLLSLCVKKMLKEKVGSLVVQENGMLKGFVTEKDIIEKVIAKGLNPKKTRVKEVMSDVIITVKPNMDVLDAIRIMAKHNVRRLPVVTDNNQLVGLLTIKDVLKIQPDLFEIIMEKCRAFSTER